MHLEPPEFSPATRLLEKRRQQYEADEALEAARQAYATQAGVREGGSRGYLAGRPAPLVQRNMIN